MGDISVRSEGVRASFFGRGKSSSGRGRLSRGLFGELGKWHGPDGAICDVSVSASLCSDVLRGSSTPGSSRPQEQKRRSTRTARYRRPPTALAARSPPPRRPPPRLRGGVANSGLDGDHRGDPDAALGTTVTPATTRKEGDSDAGLQQSTSAKCTPSRPRRIDPVRDGRESVCSAPPSGSREGNEDDGEEDGDGRRAGRQDRVRETLDRHRRDRRALPRALATLERRAATALAELREAEAAAAEEIRQREDALRGARGGGAQAAAGAAAARADRGALVTTLETKLVRQARVIRKHKDAIGRCKARREARLEEMARREEREAGRAEDYCRLRERCDAATEQMTQSQRTLQENIEEMMDLKAERERDAKAIWKLECALQQKEANLDQLGKEKSIGICMPDQWRELDEKTMEVEALEEMLEASEAAAEEARKELESKRAEAEDLKRGHAPAPGETGPGFGRAMSVESVSTARSETAEDFATALQAKGDTISSLSYTVTGYEETIQDLNSKVVKMSSMCKHDSYLQRKEFDQLQKTNAEYERKLATLQLMFDRASGSTLAPGTGRSPLTPQAQFPVARPPGILCGHPSEPQIVEELNFSDYERDGPASENGRKGELPVEC